MPFVIFVDPEVLLDVVAVVELCEPAVLEVPEVPEVLVKSSELVEVSEAESSDVAAGVPWIVSEPMPDALDSKLFCVPFSVTVTAPGLPARMVIDSVTV